MTTTLIIIAHPEPSSFTHAWAKASGQASTGLDHTVLWSDLCAMGFDAVENASHYPSDQPLFDVLKAQEAASLGACLPHDVSLEIDKIRLADRIIVHFPIWWFAPPAILNGWCDRVFVHGATHDVDHRFDAGLFRGKKVLFCASTGSRAEESAHNGKEGDIEMLLWPLAYTFRYLGFDVLKSRIIHGVHGYHEGADKADLEKRLAAALDAHRQTMANFDTLDLIAFNKDADFDHDGRLMKDAPVHSRFIRHVP